MTQGDDEEEALAGITRWQEPATDDDDDGFILSLEENIIA
jgi:hypothetical protein